MFKTLFFSLENLLLSSCLALLQELEKGKGRGTGRTALRKTVNCQFSASFWRNTMTKKNEKTPLSSSWFSCFLSVCLYPFLPFSLSTYLPQPGKTSLTFSFHLLSMTSFTLIHPHTHRHRQTNTTNLL